MDLLPMPKPPKDLEFMFFFFCNIITKIIKIIVFKSYYLTIFCLNLSSYTKIILRILPKNLIHKS